jgi:hypothetical protein
MDGRIWVGLGALSAVLVVASPARAAVPACDDAAVMAENKLRGADTDEAFAGAQAAVTRALPHCASNATLRYLKLRMDELSAKTDDRELAVALVEFPRDVRIATVFARHTHLRSDAEKAVALDRSYAPALVALADVYFRAVQLKEAILLLDRVPNLSAVDGGELLRARCLLEHGRGHEAFDAAMRVQAAKGPGLEPTTPHELQLEADAATTIRGRAQLSLGHRREGMYILVAAAATGDAEAKARLEAELAGEEAGATKAALRAIAADPRAARPWVAVAQSMLQR